jgi:hypothetical protein
MYSLHVQLAVSRQANFSDNQAGAQEDNSPVGPLKMQLPDLTQDSDKGRVTVLTENHQVGQSEQEPHASAELSEDSDQQDGASAVPTSGSKGTRA